MPHNNFFKKNTYTFPEINNKERIFDSEQSGQKPKSGNILKQKFPDVTIGKNVQIDQINNISIGSGSLIGEHSWLSIDSRDANQIRIKIGNIVCIGRRNTITSAGFLEIADFCMLAPNVYIGNADHIYETNHNTPILLTGVVKNKTLVIEENCWFGINSFVNGNLTIGRGSVISGNSVVLKDVPPFSVVVGNPARIVKMYDPVKNAWLRINKSDDLKIILANRESVKLPSREEYKKNLNKWGIQAVNPVLAGQEEKDSSTTSRRVTIKNTQNITEKEKCQLKYHKKDEEFRLLFKAITSYTMLTEKSLYYLFIFTKKICKDNIPGNIVEFGIEAGGSSALIASVVKKYSKQDRNLYYFDSFEGISETSNEDMLYNETKKQSIQWEEAKSTDKMKHAINMWKQLNLFNIIIAVKGYSDQILIKKKEEIGSISLLHIDVDSYNSTKKILSNLFENIIQGGTLQINKYEHYAGVRKAIHEFESQNNLNFIINKIDGKGVWFIKK